MTAPEPIVFEPWDSYVAQRDDLLLFISFDDGLTEGELPGDLPWCARIIICVREPNENGGPVSPESERLWDMEDELCSLLRDHRVACRLIGRLTYDGYREIVFQLRDWESFRPPVGSWMSRHGDYEMEVSEHEGWDFFDTCLRPTVEDRLFIADRSVVDALVESGSDPAKEHGLEYAFRGNEAGLRQLAKALGERGYKPTNGLDFSAGQIVMIKHLPLELFRIVDESLANHRAAEETGVELDGWGAAVVQ